MKTWSLVSRGLLAVALWACGATLAPAQRPPEQLDAAAILHRMHKLEVLGSVLYIAAHPDDENTRLISYLSNGRKLRTAYLSLTRGDGGQNLIGPELGDALGIIRTQELLEARRIDGGEQFFTRAVDFGYSKNPEETFSKWGRQAVLADVVRVVRTFRPDVIITRFATDGSGGHGHHTASALLAHEAFDLAADPKAYPEQLQEGLQPWKTTRLFFNASTWWRSDLAEVSQKDPANWLKLDVGGFDPLLGLSYTEIAGRSRSLHKSQGFGAAETRGELTEYLRLEKGAKLSAPDLFDGIETGWSRVEGGEQAQAMITSMIESFDARAPEASVDELVLLEQALSTLAINLGFAKDPESEWAFLHRELARALIQHCCGLTVEATAKSTRAAPGDSLAVTWSVMKRSSGASFRAGEITVHGGDSVPFDAELPWNRAATKEFGLTVDHTLAIDQPYWLERPHGGLYDIDGHAYRGIEACNTASLWLSGSLTMPDGPPAQAARALMYKWVDRVDGERTRPVVITPIASIDVGDTVAIVRGELARVSVEIEALTDELSGTLQVSLPAGWKLEKQPAAVESMRRGERRRVDIGVLRGAQAVAGMLQFTFSGPRGSSDRTLHVIDYPHILPQTWYTPAAIELVPLDVEVSSRTVGFIDGAGDDVPNALHRLGVAVERIDPSNTSAAELSKFDAIVTGIRAYNTLPALAHFNAVLLDYVEQGGTLLVQYNTAGGDLVLDAKKLGPYPFALTRERVTVEEAPTTFLDPAHALLNIPNRLTPADFEGWVQERGLYFTGERDAKYAAPIAWNDPGEKPLHGALIACDHGKGRYVYTGISLFRQLPAGVPGAYRLLANLISRRAPRE